MRGLSPVAASGGHSSSRCAGLSLLRPLLLQSTGSKRTGSVIVAHGPSCSTACGIPPDQGSNPCPLHRQADSQPLHHQGSPIILFLIFKDPSQYFLYWLYQFIFPPAVYKGFLSSTVLLTFIFCLFDNSHSKRCEVIPHCGDLHFPDD